MDATLRGWCCTENVRVAFGEDRDRCDIKVNDKPPRSHGKGLRAVLHAAFSVALRRYRHAYGKPRSGFVILDSRLIPVKPRRGPTMRTVTGDDKIGRRIELMFRNAASAPDPALKLLVPENKQPVEDIHEVLNLQLFAGEAAGAAERAGVISGFSARC